MMKPMARWAFAMVVVVTALFVLVPAALAADEEVCIGPRELLEYLKAPPMPMPSTVMWAVLEGDQARAFVRQAGGASVASFVGVVYLVYVPRKFPNQIMAMLADEAGCSILMSGKRSVNAGKGAGQAFSKSLVERVLRSFNLPVPTPMLFEV